MKTNTRGFNLITDYDMLTKWWNAHGSKPPKPEHLSSTGIIEEVNDKPVAAGFVYKTDSKICVFEFVVCDPKAEKEERDIALNNLIKSVIIWTKSNNYSLIYNSVKHKKYISRLEEQGFIKVDENQTHLFYEV